MLDALTLDQLRVLVMVAEIGSFSAAARRLRRVQSAISKSVRTLEETLSIQVFDRAGKYPVLTPAGSALVDDARKLLRDADALKARARGMAEGLEPELAPAVDPLFPNDVLMRALRRNSSKTSASMSMCRMTICFAGSIATLLGLIAVSDHIAEFFNDIDPKQPPR